MNLKVVEAEKWVGKLNEFLKTELNRFVLAKASDLESENRRLQKEMEKLHEGYQSDMKVKHSFSLSSSVPKFYSFFCFI